MISYGKYYTYLSKQFKFDNINLAEYPCQTDPSSQREAGRLKSIFQTNDQLLPVDRSTIKIKIFSFADIYI